MALPVTAQDAAVSNARDVLLAWKDTVSAFFLVNPDYSDAILTADATRPEGPVDALTPDPDVVTTVWVPAALVDQVMAAGDVAKAFINAHIAATGVEYSNLFGPVSAVAPTVDAIVNFIDHIQPRSRAWVWLLGIAAVTVGGFVILRAKGKI